MKPVLPQICLRYEVRNPVFHLPVIVYDIVLLNNQFAIV